MRTDWCGATYQECNSGVNAAEERFEAKMLDLGWSIQRIGFDEKKNPVHNFKRVNPFLRAIPDYLVEMGDDIRLVNVKGSTKYKLEDHKQYILWHIMCSSPECRLWLVLALPNVFVWMTMDEVRQRVTAEIQANRVSEFANDGKKYITLEVK